MKVEMTRQGVTASVRPVPTDTTMAIMPLTAERVGQDPSKVERETPLRAGSLQEVFDAFKPELKFRHTVDDTEFAADLQFRSLGDFDPEAVRSREPGQRNDIADLQGRIDTLNELRAKFAQTKVKRAWNDPEQREQILQAIQQFQGRIEQIAKGEWKGDE